MISIRRTTGVAGTSAALALALGLTTMTGVDASSHREAPLIAEDPVADNTDVYAFLDADEPGMVNFIANWIPLEEPASGPNFHAFGDDVLYTINVDIDDDAIEDVTYEFRFRTLTRRASTYLYNDASAFEGAPGYDADVDDANIAIDSPDDTDWNRPQLYTVTEVRDGVRTELANDLYTPPVNVGPRSTPNYEAIAAQAVYELPNGGSVFAGQRDEAFPVDLGSIFDLAGLRPLNQLHAAELPNEPGVDTTAGYNVHSIALQVPITEFAGDDDTIIGVWSDTYRRKTRVFLGNDGARLQHSGPWVQVSRLGMPLVNEVVIPLADKDNFNASDPVDDGQFLSYVNTPLIDDQVYALYDALNDDGEVFACYPDKSIQLANNRGDDTEERPDLVAIFLTGIPGLNQPVNGTPYEALRLNLDATLEAAPFASGGTTHFPNGRHPEDDVVDIALQAVAGAFGECAGESPNNALTDGVSVQMGEAPISAGFPFLPTPHQGYDHTHSPSS